MADPQNAIRIWINDELRRLGYGSAKMLAGHIGVKPYTLTKMRNTDGLKETRNIEAHILPDMALFFGSIPPGFDRVASLKCQSCVLKTQMNFQHTTKVEENRMPNKTPEINVRIGTNYKGTLVVGNNNTIINNTSTPQTGADLSVEQILNIDNAVNDVAEAHGTDASAIWSKLCSALDIMDSAFITQESLPAAEKILARLKGGAIREAVNQRGG